MPRETFLHLPPAKRERFIQIAIDEFADNDYTNASISRICRDAGIAKGSFYKYFEDKKELFMYLLDLAVQEKRILLSQISPPAGADVFATLRWVFQMQAQFNISHPRLAEVGYRAMNSDLPFREEWLGNMQTQAIAMYRSMLLGGVAEGSVRPNVDLDTAAHLLHTILTELTHILPQRLGINGRDLMARRLSDDEWTQANAIFDQVIDFLQHGLGSGK
ncbi:MAG: TetR/AcrR family transcriptional regulator [Chloroflexi bacterium]|nr:TetR/AcrR family transcriptional regulator [Chloroflexota bacterium]